MKLTRRALIPLLLTLIVTVCAGTPLFAVDWPQYVDDKPNLQTVFARPRGSVFSTSIIFAETGPVRSSDNGTVLACIGESNSIDSFDSPLGNTVITINNENLMSVYGNLSDITLQKSTETIREGAVIGMSGESGWQIGNAGLEYQVCDIESNAFINPLVLLPRPSDAVMPVLRGIVAVNKNGVAYRLTESRTIPAGTYSLYFELNNNFPPFSVTVFLNGKETENIIYNMLKQTGTRLTVSGKRSYAYDTVFPGNNRQLLATVSLNRGKTLLVIQAYNLLGKEHTFTYTIDVN